MGQLSLLTDKTLQVDVTRGCQDLSSSMVPWAAAASTIRHNAPFAAYRNLGALFICTKQDPRLPGDRIGVNKNMDTLIKENIPRNIQREGHMFLIPRPSCFVVLCYEVMWIFTCETAPRKWQPRPTTQAATRERSSHHKNTVLGCPMGIARHSCV